MKVRQAHKRQISHLFIALLMFGLVLLIMQLWLFVAVLENLLDGKTMMAIPAAGASLVILAIQIWMFRGIDRLDHGRD